MDKDHLYVLWTTDNEITAEYMLLMYVTNSMTRYWWKQITVVIWGASAKLIASSKRIQHKINLAQHVGVAFAACSACADSLGIRDELEKLGIKVEPWGEQLTDRIKSDSITLSV